MGLSTKNCNEQGQKYSFSASSSFASHLLLQDSGFLVCFITACWSFFLKHLQSLPGVQLLATATTRAFLLIQLLKQSSPTLLLNLQLGGTPQELRGVAGWGCHCPSVHRYYQLLLAKKIYTSQVIWLDSQEVRNKSGERLQEILSSSKKVRSSSNQKCVGSYLTSSSWRQLLCRSSYEQLISNVLACFAAHWGKLIVSSLSCRDGWLRTLRTETRKTKSCWAFRTRRNKPWRVRRRASDTNGTGKGIKCPSFSPMTVFPLFFNKNREASGNRAQK